MPTQNKIGPVAPPIPGMLKTFDADFSRGQSVLTGGQFGPEGYPWLYTCKPGLTGVTGGYPTQLRDLDGNWSDVTQEPAGIGAQTVINKEMQYYVRGFELAEFNEPPLATVVNGVLNIECRRTPDSMIDRSRCDFGFNFRSRNVDEATRTFQLKGERYRTQAPSAGSTDHYVWDKEYVGIERYMRDELDGESAIFRKEKYRSYPYTWVRLDSDVGGIYRYVKIDQIIDPGGDIDPEPIYNGQVSENGDPILDEDGAQLSGWTDPYAIHTLRIMPGELSPEEWAFFAQGATIKMCRHLPWIAPSLTTGGTFSQHYGMTEIEMKLDPHEDNFFAAWGWGNARQMKNATGFPDYDFDDRMGNGTELDYIEWPGGGDVWNKHHNMHAQIVNRHTVDDPDNQFSALDSRLPRYTDAAGDERYTMENYAAEMGLDPVVAHPEWPKHLQHGTQSNIPVGEVGYTDYAEWFTLRIVWWPPGNAQGKPGNSIEWYTSQDGSPFRRIGGGLAPPWWEEKPGLAKQMFFNGAVQGNFVTNSRYSYTKGLGSTKGGDIIRHQIRRIEVSQFPNQIAGGAGYPDENAEFSRGFLPTPNDPTGNSGSGRVPAAGTPGNRVLSGPSPDLRPGVENLGDFFDESGMLFRLASEVSTRIVDTPIKPFVAPGLGGGLDVQQVDQRISSAVQQTYAENGTGPVSGAAVAAALATVGTGSGHLTYYSATSLATAVGNAKASNDDAESGLQITATYIDNAGSEIESQTFVRSRNGPGSGDLYWRAGPVTKGGRSTAVTDVVLSNGDTVPPGVRYVLIDSPVAAGLPSDDGGDYHAVTLALPTASSPSVRIVRDGVELVRVLVTMTMSGVDHTGIEIPATGLYVEFYPKADLSGWVAVPAWVPEAYDDTALTGRVDAVDTRTLGYPTRAAAAAAVPSMPDGNRFLIAGQRYIADASITLAYSALQDQAVAGVRPDEPVTLAHYAIDTTGNVDQYDRLVAAIRQAGRESIHVPAGAIVGLRRGINLYSGTTFPAGVGGFVSPTPWIHDAREFFGDGVTTSFTVTFPLYETHVTIGDVELTKKVQPVFTSLVAENLTARNEYQLYRPTRTVVLRQPLPSGQTLRITSRRPGFMLKAVGDWSGLSNGESNGVLRFTNLTKDLPTVHGLVLHGFGIDGAGRAGNCVRGGTSDPDWRVLYLTGARDYEFQSLLYGGIVDGVSIDHVMPAVDAANLDAGVQINEDVIVPAKIPFVAGAQNTDPAAPLYVYDWWDSGAVTKANNAWDYGSYGAVVKNVVIRNHGNDRQASYWLNGHHGSFTENLIAIDGVVGSEQVESASIRDVKILTSGAMPENRAVQLDSGAWQTFFTTLPASTQPHPTSAFVTQVKVGGTNPGARAFLPVTMRRRSACFSVDLHPDTALSVTLVISGLGLTTAGATSVETTFTFSTGLLTGTTTGVRATTEDIGSGWTRVRMLVDRCESAAELSIFPERGRTTARIALAARVQLSMRPQDYAAVSRRLDARLALYEGAATSNHVDVEGIMIQTTGAAGQVGVGLTSGTSTAIRGGSIEAPVGINAHSSAFFTIAGIDLRDSPVPVANSSPAGQLATIFSGGSSLIGCPGSPDRSAARTAADAVLASLESRIASLETAS